MIRVGLQEGRYALARKICRGRKGELYHRYERGLESRLGSLCLGGSRFPVHVITGTA